MLLALTLKFTEVNREIQKGKVITNRQNVTAHLIETCATRSAA